MRAGGLVLGLAVAVAIAISVAHAAPQVPVAATVAPTIAPAPSKLAMRPKPVHGGFVDELDCSACHTPQSWRLAQGAGGSRFDHSRTGFALRGAHNQIDCGACHTGQAKPQPRCEACHRDPHQGRNDGACAECHTATAWSDTNALDRHRRTRMPLTGRHALIECTACHRRTGERAWSDLPADCYGCHRTEYHAPALHPVHDGSAGNPAFSRDCGQCHVTSAFAPAIENPGAILRTAAGRTTEHTGFVLAGSHRGVACTACHADARRMTLVRCDACHQAAALRAQHRAPVPRAASACLRCHPRGAAR